MKKIKKRLFAWIITMLMLSNIVFTDTSMLVYAAEEVSGSSWSEDFSGIASWGEAFPTDSAIGTVDEITTADSFSNTGGIQFRLDKEAICLMGSDNNMTPDITIKKDVILGESVTFSFDWSESDGSSESTNKLGVYYSFDGEKFKSIPLADGAVLPQACNGTNNTDESGKYTATIPEELITGTKLEVKVAAEDETVVTDRTGFILDNLYIAQNDTTTATNDTTVNNTGTLNPESISQIGVGEEVPADTTTCDESVVKQLPLLMGQDQLLELLYMEIYINQMTF